MTSTPLRFGALLLSISLAACGGSESFPVSGTISNLGTAGLVLENNGDTVSPAAGASTFTFPNSIDYGDSYNITVKTNPEHMTCTPYSGYTGSAGHNVAIDAVITCTQNSYALGGTITGLTLAGLVLINGSTTVAPAAADTSYSIGTVNVGTTYGVTVLTQPAGLFCQVSDGTGVMQDAAVSTANVVCVPSS